MALRHFLCGAPLAMLSVLCPFLATLSASQAQTNSFYNFITNAPSATTPMGGTDYIPITQGSVIKKVQGSTIALLNSPMIFTDTETAAITTDGAMITALSKSGITAEQIYSNAIGPGSNPAPSYDGVRGVTELNSGSTVLTVTGVAGYTVNREAIGASFPASVALFGVGICAANSSSCWGIDTILSDREGQTLDNTLTGRYLVNEFDFSVNSIHTKIAGLVIGGQGQADPGGPGGGGASGVTVGLGSGITWNYAFGTVYGSSTIFAAVGALATSGTNINSQPIVFHYFDAGGIDQFIELQATTDFLTVASSAGAGHGFLQVTHGGVNVAENYGYQVNYQYIASANANQAFLGQDVNFDAITIGNGTAPIGLNGGTAITSSTLSTVAVGTLLLGGIVSLPTLPDNGEGAIYLTTTGGIVFSGRGSVNDFTFLTGAVNASCQILTNTATFQCDSFVPMGASAPTVGMALPAAGKLGLYGTTIQLFSGATNVMDYGVTTASVLTVPGAFTVTGAITPTGGVKAAGGFTVSPRTWQTCSTGSDGATSAFTNQTPVITEVYIAEIFVPTNATITGIAIRSGTVASGNVKVGLANSSGTQLKTSVSTAVAGASGVYQLVPFTGGTYAVVGPATYYVQTFYDNTTVRGSTHTQGACGAAKQTGQTYSTGFTTITPPTTFTTALGPVANLY